MRPCTASWSTNTNRDNGERDNVRRAGLYVRVSTTEAAREGYSIGEQEKRLRSYCDAKGWAVHRVYIDGGFSGKDMERPALQDMLKDLMEGRFDVVLVYKLDRLSRSQRDTMELIEAVFLPNGIDFVSMTEDLNTSTPVGMAMIGLLAVFAQMERSVIAERMAIGREARARDGYYHGNACSPVGYDYKDGMLEVIPYEAMMVREAFELTAERMSINGICREFERRGYRHRYGPFLPRSLGKTLRNALYAGFIESGGELYDGRQEAIVSVELFERVQRILKERELDNPNRKAAFQANSALAGLVHCKRCGTKYCRVIGHVKNDGTRTKFYVCYSRNKKVPSRVTDPNCRNKIWRMDELDRTVFEEITKLGMDPEYVRSIRDASRDDKRPEKIEMLGTRIVELGEQISRLTRLYSIGDLEMEEIQAQIEPLAADRKLLKADLAALEEDLAGSAEDAYELACSFGDVLESGDLKEISFVVNELIKKIVVDGDKVTIHWAFV